MDICKLEETICGYDESAKLEFKVEFYKVNQIKPENQEDRKSWEKARQLQWGELVKDIISLANGNIGYFGEPGYLAIGISNKKNSQGTRDVRNIDEKEIATRKEILERVNSYCSPSIPNIDIKEYSIKGKRIYVIHIPPTYQMHRLSKALKTPKREFSIHAVLIRFGNGEKIYEASDEEKEILLKQRRDFVNEGTENKVKQKEGRVDPLPIEVYDRKIEMYRKVQQCLSKIAIEGSISLEDLRNLSLQIDEAIFMFDISVDNYLKEFYQKAAQLYITDKKLNDKRLPIGDERSKLAEENGEIVIWFLSQHEIVRYLFHKYIAL
ncbi:ATP-binding protein [filamentous cyanobacterium LEGE 11480]|uniref:ATP-binding protein n=1 Tax=Romeriopsis navalis LEGE 11480 TaxID=2777977 RepID=A0A928VWD6_9CYAN|nr:ATP-binding protein [Romeriopsis navalis]MBE9033389.1 ATP-binding protein [Romeriopsis navalis LEGE 11480]